MSGFDIECDRPGHEIGNDRARAVGRAVVNYQQLEILEGLAQDAADGEFDIPGPLKIGIITDTFGMTEPPSTPIYVILWLQ